MSKFFPYIVARFMLLSLLAFIACTTPVQAYQIQPNPNPSNNGIYISDIDATNSIYFINNGGISINNGQIPAILTNSNTLDNNGSVYILGILNNNSGGTLNNNSYTQICWDVGRLNNNSGGTLNNNAGARLDNNSMLYNAGLLYNYGQLYSYRFLNNYWNIYNYSYLYNDYSLYNYNGTLRNDVGAKIDNYGTITNVHGARIENYGTLDNKWTGTIDNYGQLYNYLGGTLQNSGMATNDSGCAVKNQSGASLYNYGIVDIDTFINYVGGVVYNYKELYLNSADNSSTVSNSGSITISKQLNNYATGTINNNNTLNTSGIINNYGILNNYGTLALNYGFSPTYGIFNNYLTINNTGTLNNDTELYNYNTLNNSGTINSTRLFDNRGTLNNERNGFLSVHFGSFSNHYGNALTNNGSIVVDYGRMYNNGTITGIGTYTQTQGQTINNGSLSQTLINIQGGSLSGTGTVTGDVTIASGASVHPGNSPGTLTINGTFISSGNLLFDIAGLGTGKFSLLQINGGAIFNGGDIEFDFINGFSPKAGDSWDFLFADSITGWDTLSFTLDGLGPGLSWKIDAITNGERLAITTAPVPLPSTILLLGSGLLGLGAVGWRRRRG